VCYAPVIITVAMVVQLPVAVPIPPSAILIIELLGNLQTFD
jgi:hypothetical protein